MKKFDNINIEQITKVVTYIDLECDHFKYIEPYKWLWLIKCGGYWIKEGFNSGKIDPKDIGSNKFIRDKEVFYKPHIEVHLSDGSLGRRWFESEEELIEYFNNAFSNINWLKDHKE